WLQPCLLKIYSHMVTFWGNYEGISQGKACYEDEMFSIRYFKKGSAHITFRKPELVDRLNDIIAKYYPEIIPYNI
ncbi:DUF4942 domain-containing protein, partial [Escherichia coli]